MKTAVVIGVVSAVVVLICVFVVAGGATSACKRDKTTITALRTIIQRGRDNASSLELKGTYTHEQAERARTESDFALRTLAVPDC